MNDDSDLDNLNFVALDGVVDHSFEDKSFRNAKSPNDSSHESDAALPPSKKSPAGQLGPEALLNNSTVASPNQEIRSPASADAAKTSKAQASKDPISQSLSDSSPTNNAPADLYSRKVVGWSIANHMRASLVRNALQDALSRRPGTHPLVHSDCGSQYASTELRTILWRHRLRQSLSRKGDCWDNAPTESFFGTLKQQLDIYCLRPSATLKDEIIEYIEIFYNRRRLHSSLGYKAPEEFDNEYWSVKAAS